MKTIKTFDEKVVSDSVSPSEMHISNSAPAVLKNAVMQILMKNSNEEKSNFFDEFIDQCSMYFLDSSDDEDDSDFGLFEDRVMLSKDFALAFRNYQKTVDDDSNSQGMAHRTV